MRRVAGIDVGGTFTDLLLYEAGPEGSRVHLAKIPTTAPNQADGVVAAIAQAGVRPRPLHLVIHRTTNTTQTPLPGEGGTEGPLHTRRLPRTPQPRPRAPPQA